MRSALLQDISPLSVHGLHPHLGFSQRYLCQDSCKKLIWERYCASIHCQLAAFKSVDLDQDQSYNLNNTYTHKRQVGHWDPVHFVEATKKGFKKVSNMSYCNRLLWKPCIMSDINIFIRFTSVQ